MTERFADKPIPASDGKPPRRREEILTRRITAWVLAALVVMVGGAQFTLAAWPGEAHLPRALCRGRGDCEQYACGQSLFASEA